MHFAVSCIGLMDLLLQREGVDLRITTYKVTATSVSCADTTHTYVYYTHTHMHTRPHTHIHIRIHTYNLLVAQSKHLCMHVSCSIKHIMLRSFVVSNVCMYARKPVCIRYLRMTRTVCGYQQNGQMESADDRIYVCCQIYACPHTPSYIYTCIHKL
jgi:hypothetical protein